MNSAFNSHAAVTTSVTLRYRVARDIGVNIPGYAYFGREPYSTVDRIERRFQFSDNGTITSGRHTFKVGVDFNILQLRSAKPQIFELDFGGDVDFGGISIFPAGIPQPSALQAYGLGVPTDLHSGHRHFQSSPSTIFPSVSLLRIPGASPEN